MFLPLLLGLQFVSATLIGIPTVPFNISGSHALFHLAGVKSIVVDAQFQHSRDTSGETLIPPTLLEFATTFQADLQMLGIHASIAVASSDARTSNDIFLTLGSNPGFVDAAGRHTAEAYSLTVSNQGVVVVGASPLGAWWATRTILQQAVLGNLSIPVGSGIDTPGWGTRGIMLDAGRHFYPAPFLIELCAYISYFKQNTFHVHLSDNLFNNPDYTPEQRANLYSAFRLNSPNPQLTGLAWRTNETYTQDVFNNVQTQCAVRGVTIIPEIEAPGHALVITQWKPELALTEDASLLNITEPETIPTMKLIWSEFLPWFHSKSVHIGADEYDSDLADDYNLFVNTMSDFILKESGKNIRIWGTNEPGRSSNVSTNVTIQHWEFFEDTPLTLLKQGYNVINSDDGFYIVAKFSGSYPQSLNITRIFAGNPAGGAFAPNIFDTSRPSMNPPRNHPGVVGHIAAQWNDFGPNATSVLEVYYDWRDGLAGLADKQWGGELTLAQYNAIFGTLQRSVPGQNLDRRIKSVGNTIIDFQFANSGQSKKVVDISGNGYDGTASSGVTIKDSTAFFSGVDSTIKTPLVSKGPPYTLSFSVNPSSSTPGPLFSSSESVLLAGNGTITNIALVTAGNPYILNYSLPLNTWTDLALIGRGNATFLRVNGGEMRFLARLGINGQSFVWRDISVVAPVAQIGGDGFMGGIRNVVLTNEA